MQVEGRGGGFVKETHVCPNPKGFYFYVLPYCSDKAKENALSLSK
jgi:hypothetical protein